MRPLFLLIISVFASENKENSDPYVNSLDSAAQNDILVKIEEDEYTKKKTSQYFGVYYGNRKQKETWCTERWSKQARKRVFNGSYKDEETAAHASDTLARKLIANGEKGHKLNFPEDDAEVYPKKVSNYIGVYSQKSDTVWRVCRYSKNEDKNVYNGYYNDEETAAHASDTLARKLIANGEKGHKLNFPDNNTEVYPEKTSIYVGVSYMSKESKWCAYRWNKTKNKNVYKGTYKDEQTTAHASDTLARELIANGEKGHKLNFPDDDTEVQPKKKTSIYVGVTYNKKIKKWRAQRHSKTEKNLVYNGTGYKNEEAAAHASDTLARELIENGEKGHKLNFPDDDTEVYPEIQNNKRKRSADSKNSQKYGQSLDKFE